ncbi:MAG: peroxiredoxin [Treponema sp.]|jgi:peroxiredoxin (alkyl hydroperoxide reductase subunit C)|nr:peroxiredoxin [Treponema sp.]
MSQDLHMPLLGDTFPELFVQTTQGPLHLPHDMRGSWFVFFSHPSEYTPVCTTEFLSFQKLMPEFDKLGIKLVGMAIDQIAAHIKWIEWVKEKLGADITIPLIAANDAIAMDVGMMRSGSFSVREVFIADQEGKIRLIHTYPQEIGFNMEEILRAAKALQVADRNGVSLPANWPNNDLIQDKVIIPPPDTVAGAEEYKKKYDGYDWWFSYQAIPSP